MPSEFTQTRPREAHWSRDYVEHLRTVHFALIGAAAALIILVLTKPFDLRRAASEADKVLEMKQKWSSMPPSHLG